MLLSSLLACGILLAATSMQRRSGLRTSMSFLSAKVQTQCLAGLGGYKSKSRDGLGGRQKSNAVASVRKRFQIQTLGLQTWISLSPSESRAFHWNDHLHNLWKNSSSGLVYTSGCSSSRLRFLLACPCGVLLVSAQVSMTNMMVCAHANSPPGRRLGTPA